MTGDAVLGVVAAAQFRDPQLQVVWDALNRGIHIDSLRELYNGLSQEERRPPLSIETNVAFGFDTNVVFRLGVGPQGPNAIDYLSEMHKGPVIVPGQAVQEVWNNFLAGVEPKAKGVAKKLVELEAELTVLGQELGPLGMESKVSLQRLIESHGDWTDPAALAALDSTLKALLAVGTVPQVPRDAFYQLGAVRKETKTPPGFRDDVKNFGDYFIWADFLYGLAQADLSEVEAVVFVTNDQKADWSRNGVPHPVLVSEARAVTGKEFRLWTLENFRSHVRKMVG